MPSRPKARRPTRRKPTATRSGHRRRKPAVVVPVDRAPESAPVPVDPPAPAEAAWDLPPEATPEREFAERVPPPPAERPWPVMRRAVFFDVENSSHAPYIERMVQRLGLDRNRSRTDFVAVGNWRVIGQETARLLARHGAQLVHSAPAVGVRDWSDLRIAVSAGVWLAGGRPGDVVEIVSDDRAFDAVGDVAAALGIQFSRLSYRAVSGAPAAEAPAERRGAGARRRGRRSRRRGPGRAAGSTPPPAPRQAEPRASAPAPAPPPPEPAAEPHTAPHDEIIHVVRDLIERAQGRPVLIDTVARELKTLGFSRPPGSPRLITRLRRIKEIGVSATGMISLTPAARTEPSPPHPMWVGLPDGGAAAPGAKDEQAPGPGPADAAPPAAPAAPRSARRGSRRRRRGGRGRRPSPA